MVICSISRFTCNLDPTFVKRIDLPLEIDTTRYFLAMFSTQKGAGRRKQRVKERRWYRVPRDRDGRWHLEQSRLVKWTRVRWWECAISPPPSTFQRRHNSQERGPGGAWRWWGWWWWRLGGHAYVKTTGTLDSKFLSNFFLKFSKFIL